MESTEESSEKGFLCLSLDQVIVSANGDNILIPHKALLQEPLTPKPQSKQKRRRSSRHCSTFQSSDKVLRRSSLRHSTEQDFNRRDSRLSFYEETTTRPKANMPLSPPQTPTSSSIYSRSVMDTPSAPRKRNGRTIPDFHFPRYGLPVKQYPRRKRVMNVHDLPGRRDGERMAFVHVDDDSHEAKKLKKRDFPKFPQVVSAIVPKSAAQPKASAKRPAPDVSIEAVATGFVDAHFGMPCVTNSLRHLLTCGHTICTNEPEVCANNCTEPYDSGQLRDRDSPFECMQCITNHVQDMQYGRLAMFTAEVSERARETYKSNEWVSDKIGFMREAWQEDDLEEITNLREKGRGRRCTALWIEPEMQFLVDAVSNHSQTPLKGCLERYASPAWTQRQIQDPCTPMSRTSLEEKAVSPRPSIDTVATTESGTPSLRQSVTKLFARRGKKETIVAPPLPPVDDFRSHDTTASHDHDEPGIEEVTMEFEKGDDDGRLSHELEARSRPKTGRMIIREAG